MSYVAPGRRVFDTVQATPHFTCPQGSQDVRQCIPRRKLSRTPPAINVIQHSPMVCEPTDSHIFDVFTVFMLARVASTCVNVLLRMLKDI